MDGIALLATIDAYDKAMDNAEAATVKRVNQRLTQALGNIRDDLTTYYESLEQQGSLAAQMQVRRSEELSALLGQIDPEYDSYYQDEFTGLLETANQAGTLLGDELLASYGANSLVGSFTTIPYAAIANQASQGLVRLSRHTATFRDTASGVIELGLIQGKGAKWMQKELEKSLDITKKKAEDIARTEASSALNAAAEQRYAAAGITKVQLLITPSQNVCPFCAARNGAVFDLGKIKVPQHVRCRCMLTPYDDAWADAGLVDEKFIINYHNKGIAELRKNGLEPDYTGAAPFERANKLPIPKTSWTPRGKDAAAAREFTGVKTAKEESKSKKSIGEMPDEKFAAANFKLIGEGVEGRVYSDGKLAYKYTNVVEGDQQTFVENQRREALANVKAVGDLGVGPRIYTISKDASAYTMDLLVGYEEGISPYAIGSKEERPYSGQFINHLKTLEKNGRSPLDIKEDNVMFNPKTKDVLLIDQGHTKKVSAADRAKLLFDPAGSRPLAQEVISTYVNKYGSKDDIKEYKKLQNQYKKEILSPDPFGSKSKPKTEAQHKEYIDRLFGIVDKVGLPPAKTTVVKKAAEITSKVTKNKAAKVQTIKAATKPKATTAAKATQTADQKLITTYGEKASKAREQNRAIKQKLKDGKITSDAAEVARQKLRNTVRKNSEKLASEIAANLKPSLVNLPAMHGMSEKETLQRVMFNGFEIYADQFKPGSPAMNSMVEWVEDGWFPESLQRHTRRIVFSSQANKEDEVWAIMYDMPGFESRATGGNGNIVVYKNNLFPHGSASHEMGHNLATARYGSSTPPSNSDFGRIAANTKAPTEYGAASHAEDFADSMKLYMRVRNDLENPDTENFRATHPERYRIMERLINDPTYKG